MGFPNFKGKHAKESMWSPQDWLKYRKKVWKFNISEIPKSVIFCYALPLTKYAFRVNKYKHLANLRPILGADLSILRKDKNIGFVNNFGIGASTVASLMERLIALGVKKFISIGHAGTLQKNIQIGDIVVCDRAIRDEGPSHHYMKPSKYAHTSKELTTQIIHCFNKIDCKYIRGTSWTTDAPYRETVAEAKRYQKEGVATVEMEASALFAVAKYRKVQVGAVFAVSDSLANLNWKPNFDDKKTEKSLETIYHVAIDVLSNS